MRLEIGSGEFPDEAYQVHVDILALPAVAVVCAMDRLPFRSRCFDGLRIEPEDTCNMRARARVPAAN